MLRKWLTSAFPEIEKISQNMGPTLGQKWWKIVSLMKRCIRSPKPHRRVFRFFARYYDAEEVIHKRISRNWEDISNPGPKAMPKIIKNWTFNEEVHRIRKISQSRFSLFWKVLRCWKRDSSAHFLKLRKYLKRWAQIRPKIMKNSSLNAKVHRIHKTSQKHFFSLFLQDITMLRNWFISAFPEIEKISQKMGPN